MLDSDFVLPGSANDRDIAFPRFFQKPKKLEFQSAQEGKPVYETRDYVEITTPGDTRSIPVREVTDADKARWPREWAAYKENRELSPVGTPLEKWPLIDVGQIEHYKHFRIRTVEALSQVSDNQLPNLGMGAREMRDRAKAWLAEAKNSSGISTIIAERDGLKNEVETLKAQLNELATLVKAKDASGSESSAPASSAPAIDPAAIQRMISEGIAAAMMAGTAQEPKVKRKRRTPEEMAAARAAEEQGADS